MISLILQAVRLFMPSNLCSRSQHLKVKKFLYDKRKPIAYHFTNNWVWDVLGHTLSWPTHSSDFSITGDSINSPKLWTWKKHTFFEKKRYLCDENKLLAFFSHTRALQISNLFVRLGRMSYSNRCFTSYDVMSAALTLSVQLAIIKKKSYLSDKAINWPFVSSFWGWEASVFFELGFKR